MNDPLSGGLTRRALLAGSALAATALAEANAMDENAAAGFIDAHSHIWSPDVAKFPLVGGQTKADLKPASFTDDELLAIAKPLGVSRVVLIQHSIYHLFDNTYLVDAARRHPERFRVVGMVDDRRPLPGEAMKELLAKGVTGFRITPFIRKNKPQEWLDGPGMEAMWRTGAATQQAMCCLINPEDLPRVDKMCAAHPDTPVVIDHFARIGTGGEMRDADIAQLCKLARHKKAHVKVSAFYALGKKKPPHDELIPMIKRIYEAFGPERLMWASDAPYQLENGNTYAASLNLVRERLDFLTAAGKQHVLQRTAERVFFFKLA